MRPALRTGGRRVPAERPAARCAPTRLHCTARVEQACMHTPACARTRVCARSDGVLLLARSFAAMLRSAPCRLDGSAPCTLLMVCAVVTLPVDEGHHMRCCRPGMPALSANAYTRGLSSVAESAKPFGAT
jgi:hypothetical protein